MTEWQDDKGWSDRFLIEIKRILGEYLITSAPIEDGAERNTDLIVLKFDSVRIACRIRRYKYLDRYANQFTIRSGRPSGAKTELTKIIEGWGDYFFYGFSNQTETALALWHLCDLKVFRLWFNQQIFAGKKPWIPQNNNDNSSSFLAFNLDNLPENFIIATNVSRETF